MLAELRELGAPTEGLFDKESVAEALEKARRASAVSGAGDNGGASGTSGRGQQAAAIEAPIAWRDAAALYAGITTQQGRYASATLELAGGAATFVLDTAASNTLILPASAQRLNGKKTGASAGPGIGGTGATSGGSQFAFGQASLSGTSLPLRGGLTAISMELPTGRDTDGIIGLDVLNQLDAVEWTWDESKMRTWGLAALDRPSWDALHAGLEDCALTPTNFGMVLVDVYVDGNPEPIKALLDTGACFTTFNSAAASACGIATDPSIEPMWVAGAGGTPVALGVASRDASLRIGSASHRPINGLRPLIGDIPALAHLGLPASAPALLLGLDALFRRPRVVVSTAWRRLWL